MPSGLHPSFDFVCSGIQPPNPAEMLLSEKLDGLFERLRAEYNYVLIDSTPALAVADAVVTDRLAGLCLCRARGRARPSPAARH